MSTAEDSRLSELIEAFAAFQAEPSERSRDRIHASVRSQTSALKARAWPVDRIIQAIRAASQAGFVDPPNSPIVEEAVAICVQEYRWADEHSRES